jgi:hypothetical protein
LRRRLRLLALALTLGGSNLKPCLHDLQLRLVAALQLRDLNSMLRAEARKPRLLYWV